MTFVSDLADRARASAWVQGEPGLVDAVGEWVDDVGASRARLGDEASRVATPGVIPPDRLFRHATAAGVSRAVRAITRLPGDLQSLAPVRDTQQWAMDAGIEAFADQLALSGPASHEVARIIVGSGSLFPSVLRIELEARTIETPHIDAETVQAIAQGHVEGLSEVSDQPVTSMPVSQMHVARLPDGRPGYVRVRRPGVSREIRADARLSASGAAAMNRVMPAAGGMGPIGFVELIVRYGLEATDMRYEALNVVELGLILEEGGHDALVVARPIPGTVSKRVLAFEYLDGVPLARTSSAIADPEGVMAALTAITFESALVHGTFWADPAAEHLLLLRDGRVALVGAGTVGHFSPQLRRAGICFLRSVMSGDYAGQVEAMRIADATPAGLDVAALESELESAEALQVSTIIFGGEQALLDALAATVRILLQYDIKPPVEVGLLLRTVFALDSVAKRIMPEGGGLMATIMSLMPRLPELLADTESEVPGSSS